MKEKNLYDIHNLVCFMPANCYIHRMAEYYYIIANLNSEQEEFIDEQAMQVYQSTGIEEFSIDEPKVDEILGERSYSGGDVPESVIFEVESVVQKTELVKKYYFNNEQDGEKFKKYLISQNIQSNLVAEEIKDWNKEWKKNYHPIVVGEDLEIIPEWYQDNYKSQSKNQVYIYPGQGFGTGSHETTYLCLKLLLELEYIKFKSCLDFGCGSGILGIALEIMNPNSEIDLYDIDPQALENSQQNIDLNKVSPSSFRLILPNNRELIEKKYDLVFANILQNVLLLEADNLLNYISDGGFIILSGLLSGQEDEVINKYESIDPSLKLVKVIKKGDWVAVLMEKN